MTDVFLVIDIHNDKIVLGACDSFEGAQEWVKSFSGGVDFRWRKITGYSSLPQHWFGYSVHDGPDEEYMISQHRIRTTEE